MREYDGMKNKDEVLAEKRYAILEPYLKKEKSLKEISKDENISYSTLKRWVSSYKKNGAEGLKKTKRKDKHTYRSINNETLEYIKELYEKEPNLKVWDYYKHISNFLKKIGAKTISYDTIYRIINQLDPFIKNYASDNLNKAKGSNDVFELEYHQLDLLLLDEREDILKKPYLNIIYDNYSKAISSFYLTFDKITLDEALVLLREAILENGNYSMAIYGKPKELVINNLKYTDKNRLEEIKKELNIDISFIPNNTNKLSDFFNDFNYHYLKEVIITLDIDINMNKLNKLLKKYIERIYNLEKKEKWYNSLEKLERIEDISQLDILLTKYRSKRKVLNNEIRFQNLYYKSLLLEEFEGKEVEIKFNPIDLNKIKAYHKKSFICDLYCEVLGDARINMYEFLSIKKAIKIKYLNENINLKTFATEFRYFVELKEEEKI